MSINSSDGSEIYRGNRTRKNKNNLQSTSINNFNRNFQQPNNFGQNSSYKSTPYQSCDNSTCNNSKPVNKSGWMFNSQTGSYETSSSNNYNMPQVIPQSKNTFLSNSDSYMSYINNNDNSYDSTDYMNDYQVFSESSISQSTKENHF
jgi:hypothetical protein